MIRITVFIALLTAPGQPATRVENLPRVQDCITVVQAWKAQQAGNNGSCAKVEQYVRR
jgi:hypothetical protein